MSQLDDFFFSARLKDVRCLSTLIKSVHFKDIATCRIAPDSLTFSLEDSRCLFATGLIQKTTFEDYKFVSTVLVQLDQGGALSQQGGSLSQPSQQHHRRIPDGFTEDGAVVFGVNLATLQSCLNMFGTAGSTSNGSDGSRGANGARTRGESGGLGGGGSGSGVVTAIKIGYKGPGSRLELTLEDNGIVTTCAIPTFDPEPPVEYDFNEEVLSKIIMKSQYLEEGLLDLDATSDRVVLRISPEIPHLRISSLGTVENLDVNYSQGDVIETFDYPFERPIEVNYNFGHVLNVLKACQVSSKANIMVDDKELLKIQFLLPVPDHKFMFAQYSFMPIETMD